MLPMSRLRKPLCALAPLALVLALGCDVARTPTASDGPDPAAPQPAAKLLALPGDGITVSGLIGALGGTLTVVEANGPGTADDLRVDFDVDPGALTSLTSIVMTVLEDSASGDLVMDMSPDGLDFGGDAELDVHLGEDLVDLDVDDITAWHEHDGQVDDATITYRSHTGDTVRVKIAVPGFSRYGCRK